MTICVVSAMEKASRGGRGREVISMFAEGGWGSLCVRITNLGTSCSFSYEDLLLLSRNILLVL
jgi:hypothetical protein